MSRARRMAPPASVEDEKAHTERHEQAYADLLRVRAEYESPFTAAVERNEWDDLPSPV